MSEKLRVGYVVKRYPRFSETFIVNEMLAHEEAGWELAIFALRPPCDAHFQDRISRVRAAVTYLPFERPKASALWDALQAAQSDLPSFHSAFPDCLAASVQDAYQAVHLAQAVRQRGIDLLHAHFATSAAEVTRLAARLAGIPFTLTAHAKDIFHDDVDARELRRKLEAAAAVITVSDFNLAFLQRRFPTAADRIVRLFNGIDLNEFVFNTRNARPPRVISVGRLVEKKGFSDLVKACAVLRDRGVYFRCQIIGDGELAASLHALIATHHLDGLVELTGGLPQGEVIRRLHEAAVVAAPCVIGSDGNRDGMPTILLESMAVGTPCIATDVTGIPEIIVHGETGILIPQRDPQQLAAAIERLIDDERARRDLAFAARARIERDFDIRVNAAKQREVFARAAASGDAAKPMRHEVA